MKGEMPVTCNVLEKALCDAEIIEVDKPDCPIQDLAERPARDLPERSVSDLHEGDEKAEVAGREPSGREPSGREPSGREPSGREPSGREPSGPSMDGLSRVNRLYKEYKEKNRKSEDRDKGSGGNDNAPGGRRRRVSKTEKTISSTLRKKVLKRNGHKCQRPGCGRTYFLEVHHIEPEGAGGATEEKNLCTSCAFCHDMVHEGKLSVEGEAPHKLTWRDGRGQIF